MNILIYEKRREKKESAISWKQILLLITMIASFHIGGPLLLMELAFLLRSVGAEVCWITNQRPSETNNVVYSLEHKMLHRGVQVVLSSIPFQLEISYLPIYFHNFIFPRFNFSFSSFFF